MANEKRIDIQVETIEGESVIIAINEENKVDKLYREALEKFDIDPGSAKYEIRFNNQALDFSLKIKEAGLTNNSVVILQRVPVVG